MTVLLLDDDVNTLFVLHAVLERTKARVIDCEDGDCAAQWCSELPAGIDLIVADVVLKDSNGPAVVRKLQPLQPSMRLLFISGFSLSELEKRGLMHGGEIQSGRVGFLQKPFPPDRFLETVTGLLAN